MTTKKWQHPNGFLCAACGEDDGHTEGCPIATLQARVKELEADRDRLWEQRDEAVAAQVQEQSRCLAAEAQLAAVRAFSPTHRHRKGGLYQELLRAIHSETGEIMVVYRDATGLSFVRPATMFDEPDRFIALSPSPEDRTDDLP